MVSEVFKVVRKLARLRDEDTVIWGELGSGFEKAKFPPGTKAGELKVELFYLLSDLANDLNVNIDKEKLKRELGLN